MTRLAFTVHIYRPNGWLLEKFRTECTRAPVAIARAKKHVQRQGRLAHFYTFVPVESPACAAAAS